MSTKTVCDVCNEDIGKENSLRVTGKIRQFPEVRIKMLFSDEAEAKGDPSLWKFPPPRKDICFHCALEALNIQNHRVKAMEEPSYLNEVRDIASMLGIRRTEHYYNVSELLAQIKINIKAAKAFKDSEVL